MANMTVYVDRAPGRSEFASEEGGSISAEIDRSGALVVRVFDRRSVTVYSEAFAPGFWFHYEVDYRTEREEAGG